MACPDRVERPFGQANKAQERPSQGLCLGPLTGACARARRSDDRIARGNLPPNPPPWGFPPQTPPYPIKGYTMGSRMQSALACERSTYRVGCLIRFCFAYRVSVLSHILVTSKETEQERTPQTPHDRELGLSKKKKRKEECRKWQKWSKSAKSCFEAILRIKKAEKHHFRPTVIPTRAKVSFASPLARAARGKRICRRGGPLQPPATQADGLSSRSRSEAATATGVTKGRSKQVRAHQSKRSDAKTKAKMVEKKMADGPFPILEAPFERPFWHADAAALSKPYRDLPGPLWSPSRSSLLFSQQGAA